SLPPAGIAARLHEAMRYAALNGGKRVRSLLVFAAGDLTEGAEKPLLACAQAVELIHAYSLVHDDLPAMDDDVLRRGRPTCHVEFDEATALLAGDALQPRAFDLLAAPGLIGAARQLKLLAILARASGFLGMAGGQALDLAAVGKQPSQPELELMHAMKTGALIRAAVFLGANCGRTTLTVARQAKLDCFAKRVGLLFQVIDDLLDCTASTVTLGKTAGKDKTADKPTYVSLMGVVAARDYAENLRREALRSLAEFGARGECLAAMTDFICARQF
ncbi:MAG: polyprenyl synthetase family protein, partial [Zoogloeaceae bacterium]|nr:polyprenyl synthetase family protein [Zoogloeaceae bacterium]